MSTKCHGFLWKVSHHSSGLYSDLRPPHIHSIINRFMTGKRHVLWINNQRRRKMLRVKGQSRVSQRLYLIVLSCTWSPSWKFVEVLCFYWLQCKHSGVDSFTRKNLLGGFAKLYLFPLQGICLYSSACLVGFWNVLDYMALGCGDAVVMSGYMLMCQSANESFYCCCFIYLSRSIPTERNSIAALLVAMECSTSKKTVLNHF